MRSIFTVVIMLAVAACGPRGTIYDASEHKLVPYAETRDENVIGQNTFARMARQDPQRYCKMLPRSASGDLEKLISFGQIAYGNSVMTNMMLLEGSAFSSKIIWQQIGDRGNGLAARTVSDSCFYVPAT
jgi:hypothetical protein